MIAATQIRAVGWPADNIFGLTMPKGGTTRLTESNTGVNQRRRGGKTRHARYISLVTCARGPA
jgi:hypothetical protein